MKWTVDSEQLLVGWIKTKLGEVCKKVEYGSSAKSKPQGEIPVLRMGNIQNGVIDWNDLVYTTDQEEIDKYLLKHNDILFNRTNSADHVGKTAIYKGEKPATFAGYLIRIHRKENLIDAEFLNYYLNSTAVREYGKSVMSRSVNQANINGTKLKEYPIILPPLPEQKRIVAILDEAFEGIDRAIANTDKNLANSRELFESYLNAIFTQKGDGWEEKKLEDICSITSKLVDPRQPDFLDLPHVGAGNMISMTGELIEVKTAREEELKSGKFLFDETMVLYSKIRPYLMKSCRPEFSGLCSADVYPLLPNNGQLNRDFLFHLLMSRNFTNYAIAGSDRAGMPKVNRDHLFRYSTWIPSLSEQINIAQKIDEIASETQRLETIYRKKIAALNELKQSILQKAFTGELTADTAKTAKEEIAA